MAYDSTNTGAEVDAAVAKVKARSGDLIDGSGNATKITKFSGANTITDSIITDSGSAVTIAGNLEASGDLTVDTTTLKVDSTNNRVGIGTASPSNAFHVAESSTDFAALITNSTSSGNGLKINAGDNSGDRVLELNDKDGNALMRVGSTGLVGIGTASPSQLLDVNGQARVVGNLFVGTDDTTPNGLIEVYGGGTGQNEGGEIHLRTAADFDSTYNHYFIDAYQDDLRIGRAGGADITLTSAGNVGIGTTAPDKNLVVAGVGSEIIIDDTDATDTPRLRFRESGITSGSIFTDASDLIFDTGTTERVRITSAGNVGIGTASPSKSLVVNENDSECVIVVNSSDSGTAGIYFGDQSDEIVGGVVFDNSTDKLELRSSNNNTAVTIDNSERVGIGTASPSTTLDVNGTATVSGDTVLNSDLEINVSGASNASKAIVINSSGTNFESDAGLIQGTHAGGGSLTGGYWLKFNANSADKFTVKGNGDTAIDGELTVKGGGSGSVVVNDEDSSLCPTMTFLRNGAGTTSNDFIKFENSAGEVGSINSSGGGYFSGAVGIGGTNSAHALDVTGTGRFSTGVTFGSDTAAANKLDDYEEGTWTPVITFGGGNTGVAYSYQVGTYTKIGDLVTASCYMSLSSKGSSTGAAVLKELPFTSRNLTANLVPAALRLSNISFADFPMGWNQASSKDIHLQETTNAGTTTNLTDANFSNSSEVMISISYRV